MSRRLANGQCSIKRHASAFSALLTPGTSVEFSVSGGKVRGTLNDIPISGVGGFDATYDYNDSVWNITYQGGSLVSGLPAQLPFGSLVWKPSNSSGHAVVTTTGDLTSSAPFTGDLNTYSFKLTGRTASITIGVINDVSTPACDLTAVIPGVTDCAADFPTCLNECQAAGGL